MGHATDLITEQHDRLRPHVRCNPTLAIRKRIQWPERKNTCHADEPYWTPLEARRRLTALDELYTARGYTITRWPHGRTTATSAANTVTYWIEVL